MRLLESNFQLPRERIPAYVHMGRTPPEHCRKVQSECDNPRCKDKRKRRVGSKPISRRANRACARCDVLAADSLGACSPRMGWTLAAGCVLCGCVGGGEAGVLGTAAASGRRILVRTCSSSPVCSCWCSRSRSCSCSCSCARSRCTRTYTYM